MRTILQDLRVALRTFVRRPGFAVVATGTLALGIGAHAALFSVVDGVLLRPIDLPASDDLVVVLQAARAGPVGRCGGTDVLDESDDRTVASRRGASPSAPK